MNKFFIDFNIFIIYTIKYIFLEQIRQPKLTREKTKPRKKNRFKKWTSKPTSPQSNRVRRYRYSVPLPPPPPLPPLLDTLPPPPRRPPAEEQRRHRRPRSDPRAIRQLRSKRNATSRLPRDAHSLRPHSWTPRFNGPVTIFDPPEAAIMTSTHFEVRVANGVGQTRRKLRNASPP